MNNLTLLAIASKQIWPQVLAVLHLQPSKIILLHSDDESESGKPAQRLQRFFSKSNLSPGCDTFLEAIPHSGFSDMENRLDDIAALHHLNAGDCVVNFTGGNKLMATAAFQWSTRRGMRAFYLERGNKITWFEPQGAEMKSRMEDLPTNGANILDAADLLACQLGEEVVQFKGELLTLNGKGQNADLGDLQAKLQGVTRLDQNAFDFRKWLNVENPTHQMPKPGDNLEYGTACALLRYSVPGVRRSVEIRTLPNSQNSEGELDLVFNWGGRLWVVDCKDRVGSENKMESLKSAFLQGGIFHKQNQSLLENLAEDLRDRDIKILREDLQQIAEVGGLLGCALAVRSVSPPRQAIEYAASRHPQVEVLLKSDLVKRLPAILAGRRPQ